ncbi:MAG: hypothetical protein GC168_15610 [Candidatus Hydrogenedens sp.]|nr:hypothetical protein [Candidatus Hydrogenedens sp.]
MIDDTKPTPDAAEAGGAELSAPETTLPVVADAAPTPTDPTDAPIVVMRPRSHAPWAFALVMLAFIASGTFLAWNFLPSVRQAQNDVTSAVSQGTAAATVVYDDLKHAVKAVTAPRVERETLISSALGALSSEGKLVVLTRTLPVDVEKRSSYKVLWDSLELGDSVVRVRVNNNAVQYVVPLDRVRAEDFAYDEARNTLTVILPEPRLDYSMIAIASDPADWDIDKQISYARFHDWWGTELLDEARAEIRGLVAQAAEEPLILKEAREKGYETLAQLVQSAAAPFAPGLAVEVQFEETPPLTLEADAWQTARAPLS